MKTYLCKFSGRTVGAIGIFHSCAATVQAENEEAARLKLYDTHEHISRLKISEVKPVPVASPFDADDIILAVQNDSAPFDAVRASVTRLRNTIDCQCERMARANTEWHDDPDAADHALYHAPAMRQFPRFVRNAALLELVRRHLETLNEDSGGFWPETFAQLQPGDVVTLNDGTPALVFTHPMGKDNSWVDVKYRHEPDGPIVTRSVEWKDIAAIEEAVTA